MTDNKTWLCPICALKTMPYGKNTCKGKPECGNEPHATGRAYVGADGYVIGKRNSVRGVGISEIANTDN